MPLLAIAGAADFISAVLRSTILLTVTPDKLRGRLSGIELAQVAGTPALGNLEAGVVASLVDLRFAIVSGGVLCVAGIADRRRWRSRRSCATTRAGRSAA